MTNITPPASRKRLRTLCGYVNGKLETLNGANRLGDTELAELKDCLREHERLDDQAMEWATVDLNDFLDCGRKIQQLLRVALQGKGMDPRRLLGDTGRV